MTGGIGYSNQELFSQRGANLVSTPFTPSSHADSRHGVGTLREQGGDLGGGSETLVVAHALGAHGGALRPELGLDNIVMAATVSGIRDVETSLSTSQQRIDAETETLIVSQQATVYENHGTDSRITEMPHVAGSDTSRYGTGGNNVPLVAIPFDTAQITSKTNRTRTEDGLPASTLNSAGQMHVATTALTAWDNQRFRIHDENGIAPTLFNNSGGGGNEIFSVKQGPQVRRLTPVECLRLQGFPDDYLDIEYRGRPASDGPKYRAVGNSMAVPVMAWIGKRIDMMEKILTDLRTI